MQHFRHVWALDAKLKKQGSPYHMGEKAVKDKPGQESMEIAGGVTGSPVEW
jgi:hypothetical protein